MIKQSRVSTKSWVSMFTGAALLVGSMGVFADTAVTFGDEDITGGTFQVSNQVTTFNLSAPFVCGTAGTPTANTSNKINAQFAGSTPANGNFLFGALSGGAQVPLSGLGSWTFSPTQGLVVTPGDPALACYSLSASGARKPTPGLFVDNFDMPFADAKVALRVVQLPSIDNNYIYKYYVDLTLPANDSPTANLYFSVRDGFDSSVFALPGGSGFYCEVALGVTSCSGQTPVASNLDKQYVVAPGASQTSKRFIVSRPLRNTGDTLPNTGKPLAIAAVFSQTGLEDRLDNNVSVGFGSLSDFDPVVNTTSTNLSGLSEGGILPGVTFSLSDDTTESAGSLLGASVTIDFNGTQVPATVNCGSSAPNPGPGSSRTCSFDIVPETNFATDVDPGTYASGVHANVVITATDPSGHSSTRTLPLHVASSDNDAPYFVLSSSIAPPDAGNGNMQTITCSKANLNAPSCQTGSTPPLSGFLSDLAPGPVGAVDERAAQYVFLGTADYGNGGNIPCTLEGTNDIFGLGGSPNLSSEGVGSVRLGYHLSGALGSALCGIAAGDGGTYSPGQGYMDTVKWFRIVVTN